MLDLIHTLATFLGLYVGFFALIAFLTKLVERLAGQ